MPAGSGSAALASMRHPREQEDDRAHVLKALGGLWLSGGRIDWARLHAGQPRQRVPLPTYPFERKEYRVQVQDYVGKAFAIAHGYSLRKQELEDWFYQPSWRRVSLPGQAGELPFPEGGTRWLVFVDDHGLGDALMGDLRSRGQSVVGVKIGPGFAGDPQQGFVMQPGSRNDYVRLLRALAAGGGAPTHIAHLWGVTRDDTPRSGLGRLGDSQDRGFYSLLFLTQALGAENVTREVRLGVVTDHMQDVIGGELARPEKATVLGPCRVVGHEHKNINCIAIDVSLPPAGSPEAGELARQLLAELVVVGRERVVAYRGRHRWVQWAEPTPLESAGGRSPLRQGGVYLITGGLGGVGLVLAEHLAEAYKARLVLTARSPLPPREQWDGWLAGHPREDGTSRRIRQVQRLEQLGSEVLVVAADVASLGQMQDVVGQAVARFGPIQGAVHSAGVAGGGVIQLKEREAAARVLAPKLEGTLVLEEVLGDQPLDFLVLCSSTEAWWGGLGQVDYCGANAFLDAFAHSRRGKGPWPTVSINWDAWKEVGMAVNTPVSGPLKQARDMSLKLGIGSRDGVEAFHRVLSAGLPQVAVFTMDLMPRLLNRFVNRKRKEEAAAAKPEDGGEAVAAAARTGEPLAGGELERAIIESWRKVLGRDHIGVNDNFFELGGDSLVALQAVALLKASLGRDVPIVTFYAAPTAAGLARALGAETAEAAAPVELGEVEQRAETRLEMMQRRRRLRTAPVGSEGGR
jgi:NAD(P)-dependent dehydrogenase (short-subunit alcohol dehydrogenase family)/acyl carrier protein